jgi:hypothetical protein
MAHPGAKDVFVNVPFDQAYEPLFVTLVGVIVFLRMEPHCVLEVREQGDGRLKRILDLIRACRLSVHDLSRVGLPARFNMPFELGLACTLKLTTPSMYEVFVLDAVDYRLDRILSDYKGRDPLIHRNSCDGMVRCLLDAFEPKVSNAASEFRRAARLLRSSAESIKTELRTKSLFGAAAFRRLVSTATAIAIERGFIDG